MEYRCAKCDLQMALNTQGEYGALLDHWAAEHTDADAFWRVVDDVRVRTECAECGSEFVAEIRVAGGQFVVRLWCDDCANDAVGELTREIRRRMVVRPIHGYEVMTNHVGCA